MTDKGLQTLRSRWLAWSIHVGLWGVLYLAVVHLSGRPPAFRETALASAGPQTAAPVAELESLLSPARPLRAPSIGDLPNPFFTRYFVPVAPPPPTTRKIALTYQGFYQTADGANHVILKLGDTFLAVNVGGTVETNLFVAQAGMQTLILTNRSAQTNILTLNLKKEIEVPLK